MLYKKQGADQVESSVIYFPVPWTWHEDKKNPSRQHTHNLAEPKWTSEETMH